MTRRKKTGKVLFLPDRVRRADCLPPNAKLLYGEIVRICSENGGVCTATNTDLAALFGLTPGAVSAHVARLKRLGWVEDLSTRTNRRRLVLGPCRRRFPWKGAVG